MISQSQVSKDWDLDLQPRGKEPAAEYVRVCKVDSEMALQYINFLTKPCQSGQQSPHVKREACI